MQSTCSRSPSLPPCLYPLGTAGCRLQQVAHAYGKRLHYPLEIRLRFVFYFALECASGWEAQQDADALTAHVAAEDTAGGRGDEMSVSHNTSPFAVFTLGTGASGGHSQHPARPFDATKRLGSF